jgi:hypothetical protein
MNHEFLHEHHHRRHEHHRRIIDDQRDARRPIDDQRDAYRSPATPSNIEPETLDRILAKVADGSLQPQTAAELIRALRTP